MATIDCSSALKGCAIIRWYRAQECKLCFIFLGKGSILESIKLGASGVAIYESRQGHVATCIAGERKVVAVQQCLTRGCIYINDYLILATYNSTMVNYNLQAIALTRC